jgi:hypothetical protein
MLRILSCVGRDERGSHRITRQSRIRRSTPGDLADGNDLRVREREVLRLILNLSSQEERFLHYLDVDPGRTELVAEGSYVRAKDPERHHTCIRVAVIPPRTCATVRGLAFTSNRVLHSGLDGEHGHFIAAYGMETAEPRLPRSVARCGQRRWPRRACSATSRVTAVTPTAERATDSAVYRATS